MVVVVDNREPRARSVGRGHGRNDHDVHARIVSSGFRGVHGTAAAHRDNGLDLILFNDGLHTVDLAVARNATKDLVATVIITIAKALLEFVVTALVSAIRADEEPACAHIAHLVPELERGIAALHVLKRLAHCPQSSHHDETPLSWV